MPSNGKQPVTESDSRRTTPTLGRRGMLKTLGAGLAAASFAGCQSTPGSSGGDSSSIKFYSAAEDTAGYAMTQGISTIVNENSDSLNVEARPSAGTKQSMQLLNQGEADIAFTALVNAHNIVNEKGAYADSPFDVEIQQLWHWYDAGFNWAFEESSGLEYVRDFAGKNIATHETGSSIHAAALKHLGHAVDVDDVNKRTLSYTAENSALSEGSVDAALDARINGAITPGYDEQMYKQFDDLRVAKWSDDAIEFVKSDQTANGGMYEPNDAQPDGYFGGRDEAWWPEVVYIAFATPEMDQETINEFMTTFWENKDGAGEYHGLLNFWKDAEFWSAKFSDLIGVHSGAEAFFDSQDVDV